MNSIWNFIKLDWAAFKPWRKYFILILAVPLLSFFTDVAVPLSSMLTLIVVTNLPCYLFASDEKNSMMQLSSSLPINKSQIVIGRYLCGIFIGLAYIIVVALIMFVCSLLTEKFSANQILYNAVLCVGIFLICLAVQFPVLFQLGYLKGKIISLMPIIIILLLLDIVGGAKVLENFSSLGIYASALLAIIGTIMVIISIILSTYIYKRKEL